MLVRVEGSVAARRRKLYVPQPERDASVALFTRSLGVRVFQPGCSEDVRRTLAKVRGTDVCNTGLESPDSVVGWAAQRHRGRFRVGEPEDARFSSRPPTHYGFSNPVVHEVALARRRVWDFHPSPALAGRLIILFARRATCGSRQPVPECRSRASFARE